MGDCGVVGTPRNDRIVLPVIIHLNENTDHHTRIAR